jgi:hypothetical protein
MLQTEIPVSFFLVKLIKGDTDIGSSGSSALWSIFATLLTVFNLDQLGPQITSEDVATHWHNTTKFNHDWPLSVRAAIRCLKNIIEKVKGSVEVLSQIEDWARGKVARYTPRHTQQKPVLIRCVCGSKSHKDYHALQNWKIIKAHWPQDLF